MGFLLLIKFHHIKNGAAQPGCATENARTQLEAAAHDISPVLDGRDFAVRLNSRIDFAAE